MKGINIEIWFEGGKMKVEKTIVSLIIMTSCENLTREPVQTPTTNKIPQRRSSNTPFDVQHGDFDL